jgi:hypothetical protein
MWQPNPYGFLPLIRLNNIYIYIYNIYYFQFSISADTCSLYSHRDSPALKMETIRSSETSVLPKMHGARSQKTLSWLILFRKFTGVSYEAVIVLSVCEAV